MILIDVGNTNTKIAWWDGKGVRDLRILKSNQRTAEECERIIKGLKGEKNKIVISSVVPAITKTMLKLKPFIIENGLPARDVLKMVNAKELGADRACNVVAALEEYGPSIVICLGTATTFDAIDKGGYKGGSIAGGLMTSLNALTSKAALLSDIELGNVNHVLGMNTTDQLRIGALHGHAGMIDRIVGDMREELEKNYTVVATGGLANTVKKYSKKIDVVDEFLTLKGCHYIYERAVHDKGLR